MGKKSLPEIYIDLENAKPTTEQEESLYNEFQETIFTPSTDILERFSQYHDGQKEAATALTNPSPETKEAAWNAILPNVKLQMEVYDFAKEISNKFCHLVDVVIKLSNEKATGGFETMPITIKCFVSCFDIILKMDEIKIKLPKLINDLAFFRRNAPSHNSDGDMDGLTEKSNMSTVFWAAPTPMLTEVINSLQSTYRDKPDGYTKLLELLGTVCDICTSILTNHHPDSEPTRLCLRCIVGATLIYDHISPNGAFGVKPTFHVKDAMTLLVEYQPKQIELINAIKYSSKHLGDESADPKIKALFN
ncbi:protein FAM49B [Histomonas meleagridis]|uniref:protein FAM49B n=1 Tax=Histomonas meleagridis TaxID=135588 RepID=UPI003559E918|nr:protein FAM49B [Histomonas meleagridis]KAH0802244.1 protein FAM49B [Histomonas meleagridis]